METAASLGLQQGGFSFDNCVRYAPRPGPIPAYRKCASHSLSERYARNHLLERTGLKAPTPQKTGTTIVGVVYKDGVVLGADTRATNDTVVADKNCEKIHYIAKNIYCCGAGTAADTENVTGSVSESLLQLAGGRPLPGLS